MGSYNNVWLTQKKYDQLLEDISIVSPDPDSTVWWFFHSKGSVTGGYNVPEMDQMLDAARAESDPKSARYCTTRSWTAAWKTAR